MKKTWDNKGREYNYEYPIQEVIKKWVSGHKI